MLCLTVHRGNLLKGLLFESPVPTHPHAMKLGISVKPSGFVAVDPVVQQNRLRESDERWKRWSLLHEFRSGNGASLRRITPSTQVGRLSESHSDIGFQLTQFPSGRKAKERKGDRSKHLKVL